MDKFNFSCPACGHDVSCDPTRSGTEMACPVCHASIIVPQQTGVPSVAAPQTDTTPGWTGYTGSTTQKTSGLAAASLVCSLLSLVTCIGWLPGIICGHLAKSRIRRDSSLKGGGIATAGLVIGYLALTLEAGAVTAKLWGFSSAMKQGIENARADLATNSITMPETQSTTIDSQPVKTAGQKSGTAKSEWTSDISNASFPDHPAAGTFRGMDFAVKNAVFRNGDVRVNAGNGMMLEILRLGASVEGQSFEVQFADDGTANPRAKMSWNEGAGNMTATYNKGFGMKLEFGEAVNDKLSAKIYLCFPDDVKSCIAGTIDMRVVKPK